MSKSGKYSNKNMGGDAFKLKSSANRGAGLERANKAMNNLDEFSIEEITLSVISAEDIAKYSACIVDKPTEDGDTPNGTLNDPKMGTMEQNVICTTCNQHIHTCPGHFGHVPLNIPIINPIFGKSIVHVLRSVCFTCGRLLLTDEMLKSKKLLRLSGLLRLERVSDVSNGVPCLFREEHGEKKIDDLIVPCKTNPKFAIPKGKGGDKNGVSFSYKEAGRKVESRLTVHKILEIFNMISDDDVEKLGFSYGSHPRNLIIRNLVVLPPKARPNTIQKGKKMEEQITQLYRQIIKLNNDIGEYNLHRTRTVTELDKEPRIKSEQDYTNSVKRYISAVNFLITNSGGEFRMDSKFDTFKGLVQRIQGKKAVIRKAIMGKRGNYTARSVIGPAPFLKLGQVAIPRVFAEFLTKPVTVTSYNIEEMQSLLDAGKVATFTSSRKNTLGRKYSPTPGYKVRVGDICDRHLMNGDYIQLGRQPTLHKQSMMAYEVVLWDSLNIGIHMSSTKPHNADFDGDEMWVFMPQTLEALVELEAIVAFKKNLISGAKSAPITGAVYDALVGLYLLTRDEPDVILDPSKTVMNSIYDTGVFKKIAEGVHSGEVFDLEFFMRTCESLGVRYNSGYGLFSLCIPSTVNVDTEDLLIRNGILIRIRPFLAADKQKGLSIDEMKNKPEGNIDEDISDVVKQFLQGEELATFLKRIENFPVLGKLKLESSKCAVVDPEFFYDCYCQMSCPPPMIEFKNRCVSVGMNFLSGRSLFSLTLPEDFSYSNAGVVIKNGMLIKGEITSETVGDGKAGTIHHMLIDEYGMDRAADFLTDITMLGENFSTIYGATVGIMDCIFSEEGKKEVDQSVRRALADVETIELDEPKDELLKQRREGKILEALDIVKSVASKVTDKEIGKRNRFYIMATSGAKGNLPGITQIAGIVGQQLLENKRFDPILPGRRALPWFPNNDKHPSARGFCVNSFFRGLRPPETFFHAATGRTSMVDMGIKTADTGAFQRKLIKATEDLVVAHDGTVRNSRDVVIQFLYGDDSFSPEKTMRIPYSNRKLESLLPVKHLVNLCNERFVNRNVKS